jgi:hypothetical protein
VVGWSRRGTAIALAFLASATLGKVAPSPASKVNPGAHTKSAVTVTARYFEGTFQPNETVTAGGELWLVSAGNGNLSGPGCRIGRVAKATMSLTSYRLASCGFNATAGSGAIFLATAVANVKSETYSVHIERFSISHHSSEVFGAVSATMYLGSDIAHTQLAYVDGSLWFYAWLPVGAEVLQLSPQNGLVKRVFKSVPSIGGAEPILVGARGYLWAAGGAGSGAGFLRVDLHNGTSRRMRLHNKFASVYDFAPVGADVFLLYLAYPSTSASVTVTAHVGRFSASGQLLKLSPSEQVGTSLVALSEGLFSVGPGRSCALPVPVWRVNEQTLRTDAIAELRPPSGPCAGSSVSVTATGKDIYALFTGTQTSLYRIEPNGH